MESIAASGTTNLSLNPCCAAVFEKWKVKYDKSVENRGRLRSTVKLLDTEFKSLEIKYRDLQKACEEQQKRVDVLEEEKGKEASLRTSLENEVAALKSEICSTKSNVACQNEELEKETTLLQARISEKEEEIDRLKQLLAEDKSRARKDKKATPSEKKKAAELKKALQCEKSRADEASEIADAANKKSEEDRILIETLNNEVKIMSQELEDTKRMFAAEKQRVIDETKNVDEEKKKAMELKRIAEANEKKVTDETHRAHNLSTMLDEEKQKVQKLLQELQELMSSQRSDASSQLDELGRSLEAEKMRVLSEKRRADLAMSEMEELKKVAEANTKKVTDETGRAHHLSTLLEEEKQKVLKLQQELQELMSCQRSAVSSQLDELEKSLEAEKKRVVSEKKRADLELSEKEELKKVAEANMKKITDETGRAHNLSTLLEEEKQKVQKLQQELQELMACQRSEVCSQLDELRKSLEAEKKRVVFEKKRADLELSEKEELKKVAEANSKKAEEEKHRADMLSQDLLNSRQRIDDLQHELKKGTCMLEVERMALEKEKSCVDSLTLKLKEQQRIAQEVEKSQLNELSKKLEVEKNKVAIKKKRADLETSAKEELKIAAEANLKIAMEEKVRADKLSRDLQSNSQRIKNLEVELNKVNCILKSERLVLAKEKDNVDTLANKLEEQTRIAVENENRAMEEKRNGDNLIQELEVVRQKLNAVENHLCDVEKSRGPAGASTSPPEFDLYQQMAKVSLLQEQLKFEKRRVKHYKEVAKSQKDSNSASQKELHEVRQDFQCLLQQMDVWSDAFGARNRLNKKPRLLNVQSLEVPQRIPSSNPPQLDFCCDAEVRLSSLSSRDTSSHLKPSTRLGHAGQPLESPSASFSDEQLLGSQERTAGPLTTLAGLEARDVNPRATITRLNDGERVGTVTKNNVIPVDLDTIHAKKRKKIVGDFESTRCIQSEGAEIIQEAETNPFGLHNPLVQPIIRHIDKVNLPVTSNNADLCGISDLTGKKRKSAHEARVVFPQVDSTMEMEMDKLKSPTPTTTSGRENCQPQQAVRSDPLVCNQVGLLSFEQELNGDYMKLLDLDDAAAEEHFRMAMKWPLSPSLPDIDLHEFEKEFESQMLGMAVCPRHNAPDPIGEHSDIPNFCVVFSAMEDIGCITRIFCATRTCIAKLHSPLRTHCLVEDILLALASEQDLIPREKVCVFFSLILVNYVGPSCTNSTEVRRHELLEYFPAHLKSVLLNAETRHLFAKVCDLSVLLCLSEDFLLHRKILLNSVMTSESLNCGDSRIEILHQAENSVLRPDSASTNMVVVGSIILASISSAAGFTGYLCEVSLKILKMRQADYSMALLILHTFASVCGEEYFTSSNYCSVMKVVRLLVNSAECSLATNGSIRPGDGTCQQSFPCERCPFAGGSICLDDVTSELLEELRGCKKYGNPADAIDSCFLVAVLSSLELLAADMSWDWVCDKVVPTLFKMLESCEHEETVSTVLVALLGDLGRLGVQAVGYDDAGVRSIIQQLSRVLLRTNILKGNTLQIAIVRALIQLHPNGHEVLKKSNEDRPAKGAHSASDSATAASDIMRTMFSSLSGEQTFALLKRLTPDIVA